MVPSPPARRALPRRHRSRPREEILAWLRATDSHPTAREIHEALRPSRPDLSLGTVYRNLDVLVADGQVDAVSAAVGPARFDGNLEPHHHFHCERCGRILDVALPAPRALTRRLRDEHGLRASRVRVDLFGLCPACEADGPTRDPTRGGREGKGPVHRSEAGAPPATKSRGTPPRRRRPQT